MGYLRNLILQFFLCCLKVRKFTTQLLHSSFAISRLNLTPFVAIKVQRPDMLKNVFLAQRLPHKSPPPRIR